MGERERAEASPSFCEKVAACGKDFVMWVSLHGARLNRITAHSRGGNAIFTRCPCTAISVNLPLAGRWKRYSLLAMKRRFFLCLLLATTLFAQNKKPDPIKDPIIDEPGLPRVLIIGDSISIGYTPGARALLKGKANVHRIPTNGASTVTGLANLDAWLGAGKWDVIHFNWGLHDLKQYKGGKLTPGEPVWVELGDYEKNLRKLVERLKQTGAKLIFATTTPVPEGANGRVPGLEDRYNEAAVRLMKTAGVAVNDLHALCAPNLAAWQNPKDVHFKPIGSTKLAEKVAAEISAAMLAKK